MAFWRTIGPHFGNAEYDVGNVFVHSGSLKTEGTAWHRCCFCPEKGLRLEKFGSACAIYNDDFITRVWIDEGL
jgi:hypothetical protein